MGGTREGREEGVRRGGLRLLGCFPKELVACLLLLGGEVERCVEGLLPHVIIAPTQLLKYRIRLNGRD